MIRFLNSLPLFIKYLIAISIIAIGLSLYDKWASKYRPKARVSEAMLLIIGVLGGAVAMFLSMIIVRHKTKHRKFMLGLPAIIILQILILYWLKNLI